MSDAYRTSSGFNAARQSALVVEDEEVVAKYLAEMLTDLGFDVTTAATVTESLALADQHGMFSVAFVDLSLPDRSGLELISDLKIRYPKLPIVIASGYGPMVSRDLVDNRDYLPILSKPYDRKVISNLLSTLGFFVPQSVS